MRPPDSAAGATVGKLGRENQDFAGGGAEKEEEPKKQTTANLGPVSALAEP